MFFVLLLIVGWLLVQLCLLVCCFGCFIWDWLLCLLYDCGGMLLVLIIWFRFAFYAFIVTFVLIVLNCDDLIWVVCDLMLVAVAFWLVLCFFRWLRWIWVCLIVLLINLLLVLWFDFVSYFWRFAVYCALRVCLFVVWDYWFIVGLICLSSVRVCWMLP